MKRLLDVVVAAAILVAATPLGTPILFPQLRPGLHGKAEKCYPIRWGGKVY